MNRIAAAALICVLILTGCTKDAQIMDRDHPMITTSLESDNESITFTGIILSEGEQQIIGYGFVYDTLYGKRVDSILFKGKPGNKFSITLHAGFAPGRLYKLRAFVRTAENYVFGNQLEFVFNSSKPVELTGFSPSRGTTGDTVVIEGKYFSRAIGGNIVRFGSDTAKVVLVEEGRLLVKVPEVPVDQICQISVKTHSSFSSLNGQFERWYNWTRIIDSVPGLDGRSTKAGDYFIIFDNREQTITSLNVHTGLSSIATQGPGSEFTYYDPIFSCENMAYLICRGSKELWQYNPESDTWTRKQDIPGQINIYSKPLVFGAIAYFLVERNNDTEVWAYDAAADLWTFKTDEINITAFSECTFTAGEKGYICKNIEYVIHVYEFDPNSGTVRYLCKYPGLGNNDLSGFFIGGKIFIGLGKFEYAYYRNAEDLWEFDPQTLEWKETWSFPNYNGNTQYSITASSEDGYVTRHYYTSDVTEVYKFDPQKQ